MQTAWSIPDDRYPPLAGDARADVVIIGGGLTGILCAYELSRGGKSAILLEKGRLGHGATEYTTAFLTQAIDTALSDLVRMFGPDSARMAWDSSGVAIAELERIAREQGAPAEFNRCPARVFARTGHELKMLAREAAAAERLGIPMALKLDDALGFPNRGYLEIPGQAKFHPLAVIQRLAADMARSGVRIHEDTGVATLSEDGPVVVRTVSGVTVHAADAIVATHWPFNNPKATRFKKGGYISYVLEARTGPTGIPEGIYWDLHRPYGYFRIDRRESSDRIIIGGGDHRREVPVPRRLIYHRLKEQLGRLLRRKPYEIVRTWSGPIIESSDGLPLIGSYAPHRFVATAFSGNGMTYAMVAALMMRDLISGKPNLWSALYDPQRAMKPQRLWIKGKDYLSEFWGGVIRPWLL